jgi:hypothetical protein
MRATKTSTARFKVGDWVTFQYGIGRVFAQIIEDRGPLGFKGRHIYRIRLDRALIEPDLLELSEHLVAAAPPLDKSSVLHYLKEGGLVTILQSNLRREQDQPRAWLSYTRAGEITHTLSGERGLVGGATVPYFALLEDKVYAAKQQQVLEFLTTFGLNRDEAKEVVQTIGTAPGPSD